MTQDIQEWGDEPTINNPPYRVLEMVKGCEDSPLIHVTPQGYHLIEMDCDGLCLTCYQDLVQR